VRLGSQSERGQVHLFHACLLRLKVCSQDLEGFDISIRLSGKRIEVLGRFARYGTNSLVGIFVAWILNQFRWETIDVCECNRINTILGDVSHFGTINSSLFQLNAFHVLLILHQLQQRGLIQLGSLLGFFQKFLLGVRLDDLRSLGRPHFSLLFGSLLSRHYSGC
jgi:hypothetical protein